MTCLARVARRAQASTPENEHQQRQDAALELAVLDIPQIVADDIIKQVMGLNENEDTNKA